MKSLFSKKKNNKTFSIILSFIFFYLIFHYWDYLKTILKKIIDIF
jgi:hypothetical protein